MQQEPPFVFIYLFLIGSGIYAIVTSLMQLKKPDDKSPVNSAIETKWFKYNAPAGLVYGIVSLLTVIAIVKLDQVSQYRTLAINLEAQVADLKKQNEALQSSVAGSVLNAPSLFSVTINTDEPKSLFGGRVLIVYETRLFSKSRLEFRGVAGLSWAEKGPFQNKDIEFGKGDKFFAKLEDDAIWGVNVINETYKVILEFYRVDMK